MAKSKLTVCKTCGAEIAKNATTCPHCGAKVKKKGAVLGVVLLLLGIALIVSVLGGNGSDKKTEYAVGEKCEKNGVAVTLLNVTESHGSAYNTPTDGNVFLLCEFEIENNSSSELSISSLMSFEGYCDGYTCPFSLTALLEKGDKNQLDGTVASGKKFNGVIGYEVASDWKQFEIQFTPSFWSGQKIKFVATH